MRTTKRWIAVLFKSSARYLTGLPAFGLQTRLSRARQLGAFPAASLLYPLVGHPCPSRQPPSPLRLSLLLK